MNRQQRRYIQRKSKGQNLILNPDKGDNVDHSKDFYCHRHKLNLENEKSPTDRDKQLIESIALKPYKSYDKYGHVEYGRMCKRCGFTVRVNEALPTLEKEIILETEEKSSVTL